MFKSYTFITKYYIEGDCIQINEIDAMYGLNWEIKVIEDAHFLILPYILESASKENDSRGRSSSIMESSATVSPYLNISLKPISKYDSIFNKYDGNAKQKLIVFLLKIPMFKTWSSTAIRRLLANVGKIHYYKGETVYKQDDDASTFYIVYEGEFIMK